MFFEKLYNLIYHIGFTAGSGFMKFGKWLSRGLSRPVKTVGAVFFAVFLVIDKFILKTFKTVSAEFKLLMADIKRVSSGLNSLIHTDRKSAEAKLRIYIKKAFSRHGIVFTFAVNLLVPIICLGVLCSTIGYCFIMSFGLCNLHSDIVYLTRNKQLVAGTNRLGKTGIQLHQFGNG